MSLPQQPLLLQTKLFRPQYEQDIVPRPHLLARLDEGLRHPLTLVSAPAGFGKTTLLSTWLEQCRMPSTWLSLDAGDNDVILFVNYLIAAIRVLHPGACAETEALTRSAPSVAASVLAHQLINELNGLPDSFVLVLDDYDQIDNRAIHELMSILVRRPPRPLRLVIAARHDPSLPLAKLRASGLLCEVRMADLRLGPEESAAYWRGSAGRSLDEESAVMLDSIIEGWPAGLRLTAISLRLSAEPAQTIAALAGSHTHVMDYLFHEIFNTLPEERQNCLLKIAALDRFCGSLCAAICAPVDGATQANNGQHFIEWLETVNLFLVPLDDQRTWFRFHHLFLQLLRQQQRKVIDSDAVATLHNRAAIWFAAAGMIEEAIHHCAQAASLGQAASLRQAVAIITQARIAVLNQEDWPRLQRWLDIFPAEFVERTPELWFVKAWVLHSQFRFGELGQLLDRIDALWQEEPLRSSGPGHAILAAEVAVLRAQSCFWYAEGKQCLMFVQRTLALAPADYTLLHGQALLYLGMAMQMTGVQEAGFARLGYELSDATRRDATLSARLLIALTGMHWVAGNLDHVGRFAQQLLEVANRHQLLASRGWGHFYLGCMHYWRNELVEAAQHFGAVVERPFGAHSMTVMQSHFGLALTYLALGRPTEALDVVEAGFALATATGSVPLLNQVEAFAARFALLQGKEAAAFAWADQHAETRPWLSMYFLEIRAFTLVRIRLVQGGVEHLAQAATVLADLRNFMLETHNTLRQIDVLALEALLHKARRQPKPALAAVQQALALAEPAAIVRPFVALGPEMAALLYEAAKQGPAAAFAAHLLGAFPLNGIQGLARDTVVQVEPAQAVDPLTERELEVLSLLGQRLSNKEIAEIMVLSPLTIKTYTSTIFGKLQVTGRREAVARGRALGLLSLA